MRLFMAVPCSAFCSATTRSKAEDAVTSDDVQISDCTERLEHALDLLTRMRRASSKGDDMLRPSHVANDINVE